MTIEVLIHGTHKNMLILLRYISERNIARLCDSTYSDLCHATAKVSAGSSRSI